MTEHEEAQLSGLLAEVPVDPAKVKDFVDRVAVKAYTEGLEEGHNCGYHAGYEDGLEYVKEKGVTL